MPCVQPSSLPITMDKQEGADYRPLLTELTRNAERAQSEIVRMQQALLQVIHRNSVVDIAASTDVHLQMLERMYKRYADSLDRADAILHGTLPEEQQQPAPADLAVLRLLESFRLLEKEYADTRFFCTLFLSQHRV